MKVKEYLLQISRIRISIQNKQERVARLKSLLETPAVLSIRPDKVQTSVSDDKMPRMVEEKLKLEDELQSLMYREAELIIQIGQQIDGLNKPEYSRLLHLRYEEHQSLMQIAELMGYEYITVRKMHGEALNDFHKKYKNCIHEYT